MASTPVVDRLEMRLDITLDVEGVHHFSVRVNSSEGEVYKVDGVAADHVFAHVQGHCNSALTVGLNGLAKKLRQHREQ